MKIGSVIRTVALWVMIVFACIADVILYINAQYIWATFWTLVILLVIGYELFAYLTKKKTISTMWKDWLISSPLIAYPTTILIWIALNALMIHLIVW